MKKLLLIVSLLSLTGCGLGAQPLTGVGSGANAMTGKAVGPNPSPVDPMLREASIAIHKAITEKESVKDKFQINQLDVTKVSTGKYHYKGWGSRSQQVFNLSGDYVVGSGISNHVAKQFTPEKPSNLPCTANPAACD